ncbi:hypothetical protein J8F10_05585 [Gemmata sp. G18]|uniref:Uncharacterized protein n=1 Tax=Gemmata palustris TaxID=2822762 RepID=A0ABS5BN70_9BACT|nr:hypothetical protein [Gemmata palustris]MBP3954755.1 hypothetical protein [Gemmata palustris]
MSELHLSRVRSGSGSAWAARPRVSAIVRRGSIAVFAPLSTARGGGIYALDSVVGVRDSKVNHDKANGG